MIVSTLLALQLAAGSTGVAPPPAAPLPETALRTLLVVSDVRRAGREATYKDAIEEMVVRGTWHTPREGETVRLPDGTTRTWKTLEAREPGVFEDESLQDGYAVAVLDAPRAGVMLLDASGHRWVYVNGEPRAGDVYGLGITRLPVVLRAGRNELLFNVTRGRLEARLTPPPAEAFIETRDTTLPDVILGEPGPLHLGLIVSNATTAWQRGLRVVARFQEIPHGGETRGEAVPVPAIPPVSTRKVDVLITVPAALAGPETENPVANAPAPDGAREVPDARDAADADDGRREAASDPSSETAPAVERRVTVLLDLTGSDGRVLHTASIELAVRHPGETHKRTFLSGIDGSVQYFAVTPAGPDASGSISAESPGLVLTLHGAGVEGAEQARRYRPRSWTHIVAPTNRRPYGFDWEDWGRLDALEVLAIAGRLLHPDPRRVWLTGHSMGGHGTWNLGAHFPGLFAAIAPSAGWRDFWSYLEDLSPSPAGAPAAPPIDPVREMLDRAANASRTLLMESNLAPEGIYILHGDRDDNVPVTQARAMRERLGAFHTNFAYYERPGAGHWWGDECMDWPPLFDFLRRNTLQEPGAQPEVDFVTVNPGVSSSYAWIGIEAQRRSMIPSRVFATVDTPARRITLTTDNVARLVIDLAMLASVPENRRETEGAPPLLAPGAPFSVTIDGQALEALPWPGAGSNAGGLPSAGAVPFERSLRLARPDKDDAWRSLASPPATAKNPDRAGPFKDAFRNRMIFVYGTAGTPEENAWALTKARYDAETFWYRGNGSVDIVADRSFDSWAEPDRNVILYGNADTNTAWSEVLADGPIVVRRGFVGVGGRFERGDDLACLFIYPRGFSRTASVGVVSGTGPAGFRLTNQLPYFVSGVGYPDWVVIDPGMPARGVEGVRGAGFFGADWSLASGDDAWRKTPAPHEAIRP